MSNIYVTADLHFSDPDIISYNGESYFDFSERDKSLIEHWNYEVSENDVVYVLGDFFNGRTSIIGNTYIGKLNGHKILIRGNHDTYSDDFYLKNVFEKVYDHPIIIDDFIILSHEPMYVSMQMPYINIYGHVHTNPSYKTFSERSACVCIERTGYTPILLNVVLGEIEKANQSYHRKKFFGPKV